MFVRTTYNNPTYLNSWRKSIMTITLTKSIVPSAISKKALQEILDSKAIPFTTKMTKEQLWELTQQSQPKAEVGRERAGEY